MIDLQLIDYLSQFISERRMNLLNNVLDFRTRYLTVVLEDIYQPQNASAVLRTCECLGIQDVHIIENQHKYYYSQGVAMGAGKWTNLIKYNTPNSNSNTTRAIENLRKNNYRIVATMPGENCVSLNDFDVLKGKVAVVFGSELTGISDEMKTSADELLTIPMFGFTESYNLSVSAAIILYQFANTMRSSNLQWQLTDDEKYALKFEWLKASIKKPELIIKNFYSSVNKL
jgi:tRNA (guanosine-2'-O-)-methyltransferase